MVKTHDKPSTKLAYRSWREFVQAMMFLHKEANGGPGLSWTQLSQTAGKDDRGWAAHAVYYRGLVTDKDRDWAMELATQHGWQGPVAPEEETPTQEDADMAKKEDLTPEARQFMAAYDELRTNWNGELTDIAKALGNTTGPQATYYKIRQGRQTGVSDETLRKVVDLLMRCRKGDVPWLAEAPTPPAPTAAEDLVAEQQEEASADQRTEPRRRQEHGEMINPGTQEHAEFKRLLDFLAQQHGYTRQRMAEAAGYMGSSSMSQFLNRGGVKFGRLRLDDLRAYVHEHFHPSKVIELGIGDVARTAPQTAPAVPAPTTGTMPPATIADAEQQILALVVLVDDHIKQIAAGLLQQAEQAPRMLRRGYEAEVAELRKAASVFSELLQDFE